MFKRTNSLERAYSARHFDLRELQGSLVELLPRCLNQTLLSADLIALLSRDGPKWESVIPSIGDLIKAAVVWTAWEANKDVNFSLEML